MPDQDPQQGHSELATFGEELRREREIRGISLKEIADATKISKRFLEAIERNDHRTLPAPVFTRGFVREYARYLGLNAEEIVNRYNFAAAGDDRIEKTAHLERLVQPREPIMPATPVRKKGIPPAYARIDRNVYLTILIVAALAGLIWWAVQAKRQRTEAADVARPAAAPAATTANTGTLPLVPVPTPAGASDMLTLTVEVVDDSWVLLHADGERIFGGDMKRGDRHTFKAKNEFRFEKIGNAAGLALTLNDAKIPPLGRDGQVLNNQIFNRKTLQDLKQPSTS